MESDLHRKIILNQSVVIQDREHPTIDGLSDKDQLVILKIHNDIVTITPVMREILDVARSPNTPDELIRWVAQSWGCSYESVYEPVCSFLKRMGRLGVLVYEENQPNKSSSVLEEFTQTGSFAGYTLLNRLSHNHKVALYKCTYGNSDSYSYTLKVMLRKNPDESTKQKFLKEFKILKSLPEHKNIRNCLYASEHEGIPYLLFEYIDGVSMSKKVDKVSLECKINITRQLMDTIDHLHRHHILHGDIHASNFLVDDQNNLHLIDLGMAHFEHEEERHHGGIPRYMPPERLPDHPFDFSEKKGDYRSEIFQIGVCLYFLFSGHYPFRGLLLKHLANAIKNESPSPLIKTPLNEIIPHSITNVISRSMEKDPLNRYSSVAEMMDAWKLVNQHEELVLT
ncbi:MAG: serine/threonine protein kinase [Bacteroidetes bacterium]|nr:serine/threonine protein kinase [Bacteroidota bacterium]MBI3481910.1 serine/threonine protein kinase [Bacteroidota bacterium]